MHCFCCDKLLTDLEATLKSATTGEYLDMCSLCLADFNIVCTPSPGATWEEDTEELEIENA